MTVVTNMHKTSFVFITCHVYESVMHVLCTPLQVKCYQMFLETFTKVVNKTLFYYSMLHENIILIFLLYNVTCNCENLLL